MYNSYRSTVNGFDQASTCYGGSNLRLQGASRVGDLLSGGEILMMLHSSKSAVVPGRQPAWRFGRIAPVSWEPRAILRSTPQRLARRRHHLPLTNLFWPIKLDRVFVENIRRLFFSQCFQNQRVIVILIRPRRASGRQVGAEHERAWIGRIEIGQRGT